ncbi:hypothetical protein ANN_05398 [Periplaneta americana]|uniref:Uncharacterized protein n=1 Tax=Periplaneta americana TaxID=6978 RepID=A0ABQ8TBW9_PERAM|nr:hypothetical protein ANN_05398 [Periplaneta americana]
MAGLCNRLLQNGAYNRFIFDRLQINRRVRAVLFNNYYSMMPHKKWKQDENHGYRKKNKDKRANTRKESGSIGHRYHCYETYKWTTVQSEWIICSLPQATFVRNDFTVPPESVSERRKIESQKIEAKEVCDRIIQETTYRFQSLRYVATLKKLQVRLSRVRRHREKQDVLLLHDNAQPYVSHKTTDQIRKFG